MRSWRRRVRAVQSFPTRRSSDLMSEVAGRLAPQAGAGALLAATGGRGVLLGGVPGVRPGKVVVIGAGVSGQNAIAMAVGLRSEEHSLNSSHMSISYAVFCLKKKN